MTRDYADLVRDRPQYYSRAGCDPTNFFASDTRNLLSDFFKHFIAAERHLEDWCQQLSKRLNFSVRSAFLWLDKDNDGHIRVSDLVELLSNNGFYPTEREI